jgi:hypothetical protein
MVVKCFILPGFDMQVQQAAQAVTQVREWSPILIGAAAAIFAAFGAAAMTLYWQRRKEKRDAKLSLFLTLMMHRKADPPNQDWVNALNIIDVVFYDDARVIESWHKLYPILQDEVKTYSEERVHSYIHLLSEMATALNYPKLQQIDIDKFYSPKIYARQAQINAQMQGEIMTFFRGALGLISEKQKGALGESMVEIGITTPEDNERVARKQDVTGYVHPAPASVQVLVFAGDNLWYPQTPILREAGKWKVMATFGEEKTPAGRSFKVVAIASESEITKPIKELPKDVPKSSVVIVTRSAAQMAPPK